MRFLLTFLGFFLLSGSAIAATVTIKSGEHGPFTRLVLYLPEVTEWKLEQDQRDVSISFPGKTYDTFLDEVFIKITRERIGEVIPSPGDGRIGLRLNCDCVATAVEYTPRILVVDVRPGKPPLDEVTPTTTAFPSIDWFDEILTPAPRPSVINLPVLEEPELDEPEIGAFAGIAEAIMQKASQGYLTTNPTTQIVEAAPSQIIPNVSTTSEDAERNGALYHLDGNHIAETRPRVRYDCGAKLRSAREVDDFVREIASLQLQLVTEGGEVSSDVVLQLARSYIYFGLPEEARHILKLADASASDQYQPVLDFLTVDSWKGGQPPKASIDCAPLAELAETLTGDATTGLDVSAAEFVQHFRSLSPYIRDLIGPRLAVALRNKNRKHYAEQLDYYLVHATPEPDSSNDVLRQNTYEHVALELEAAAATPDANASRHSKDPGHESPDIADAKAEPADPSLMHSFLKEYDGALPKVTLSKLLVSARIDERNFKAAILEIRKADALSTEDRIGLMSEVVRQASANGSTQEFLEMAFYLDADEIGRLADDQRSEARKRLLELGFDDKADAYTTKDHSPQEHASLGQRSR